MGSSAMSSMATSLSQSGTGVQDLIGALRYRNDMDLGSRTRDMRETGSAMLAPAEFALTTDEALSFAKARHVPTRLRQR